MRKLTKKGQVLDNLGVLAVGIATLAITLTIAFLIISEGRAETIDIDACGNQSPSYGSWVYNATTGNCHNATINGTAQSELSYAMNSSRTLGEAVDDIPGWIPLIVIAVIGSILLGLVAMFRRR